MRAQTVTLAVLSLANAGAAFTPRPQPARTIATTTSLDAQIDWRGPIATAALGWTLASQMATAAVPPTGDLNGVASSSAVVAVLPSKTEPVYESLDFSLPKYGASTVAGFGEGKEAYLSGGGSAGSTEKQKQEEAMKKAAAARKLQLEAKKAEEKQRMEDSKRRNAEKKKEADERVKALFSGKDL